jgi:hypothetical protein
VSWRNPRAGNADRNGAHDDAAIRCHRVHAASAAAAEAAHSGGPLVLPAQRPVLTKACWLLRAGGPAWAGEQYLDAAE